MNSVNVSPKGKVGYSAPRDIPASPAQYFNQRLLNFNQDFASDVGYIYFARSAQDQYNLRSSINFAMLKTKLGAITARVVKKDFKITIEKFVASGSVFSFMSSIKGTPAYWKQFLNNLVAMVK